MKKTWWLVIFAAVVSVSFFVAEAAVVSNTLTGTCDPQNLRVTLSWQPYAGATTNALQRGSNPLKPGSTCSQTSDYWCFLPNSGSQYTYTDTDLSANVKYEYRVKVKAADFTNSFFCDTTKVNAPSVTTKPATNVSQSGATLKSSVNPNFTDTVASFEYGVTQSLGQTVGNAQLPGINLFTDVSISLTGLQSSTIYYFRAVASNAAATTKGSILSFTTLQGPSPSPSPSPPPSSEGGHPFATTNPVSDISTTGATLRGAVNPNGASTQAWFEFGDTEFMRLSSGASTVGGGGSYIDLTSPLSGASPNTTYYYRMVAQNSFGTGYGATLSFRTAGGDGGGGGGGGGTGGGGGAAPLTRTTIATNVSRTSAVLNGSVTPNGASTQAWFEYGTTNSLGQVSDTKALGSGTAPVGVTIAVFNLQPNTIYYYRLVARNAYGVTKGAILSTSSTGSPSFTVSPAQRTINAGGTAEFVAIYDPDGEGTLPAKEVTSEATWNASSPAVAAHEGKGRFRGKSSGRTIVTAFYNSKGGAFQLDDTSNLTAQGLLAVNQPGSALLVHTDAATDVTSGSATLHGSVDTSNAKTDAWFEYGSNEFLGQAAGRRQFGGSDVPVEVSAAVSDLAPNTTYYYRLVAQNALGTLYGSIMSFTTPPARARGVLAVVAFVVLGVAIVGGIVFAAVKLIRRWGEGGEDEIANK